MREIKFRVWDKKGGRMYPVTALFSWKGDELNRISLATERGETQDIPIGDRFVLMQYTGLKDKNGREIYEGDIVKDESDGMITVIKWNNECAGFVNVLYVKDSKDIEVIGNIYENPELLERRR